MAVSSKGEAFFKVDNDYFDGSFTVN